jgi:hypothetical protein
MQFHTAILTNAWNANGPGIKGDKCNPGANTVIGRVSQVALCLPQYRAFDVVYAADSKVIMPIVGSIESNSITTFNFHDFVDGKFVDQVPTSHPQVPTPPDPVGFPRLP